MSATPSASHKTVPDAITAEEITGEALGHDPQPPGDSSLQKRPNAFTELMTGAKKPKTTPPQQKPTYKKNGDPRDGLSTYIEHPEKNPEGRVVEYDDEFVVINDKYPKSSVHLLLLVRDPAICRQHPLHFLSTNPALLTKIRTRVERLKHLAARELRRQYGAQSVADAPYQTALEEVMSAEEPPPPEERDALLPPGRDWLKDIKAGVHTHPSMNHMHIHILSREHNSPWMKHKKHYLSFNTSFLVPLEDLPLDVDSPRFHPGDWPSLDMKCWRCGANFQNKMAALLRHVGEEIEEWKQE